MFHRFSDTHQLIVIGRNVELRATLEYPKTEGPDVPATDYIKILTECARRDVDRFRRNTEVGFRIIDKARSLRTHLNFLVAKAESSEENGWSSYDKFVRAVDPLEE